MDGINKSTAHNDVQYSAQQLTLVTWSWIRKKMIFLHHGTTQNPNFLRMHNMVSFYFFQSWLMDGINESNAHNDVQYSAQQLTLVTWSWIRKKMIFFHHGTTQNPNFLRMLTWSFFFFLILIDGWNQWEYCTQWCVVLYATTHFGYLVLDRQKIDFFPPWHHLKSKIFANA